MGVFVRTGGCFCEAVCYRVSAPANETVHCHCSICRKTFGAMFSTFSSVPTKAFWIEQGNDRIGCFENSPGNGRYFCTGCGCQIYSVMTSEPGSVYFSTATLDVGAHPGHPEGAEGHLFWGSKVPWFDSRDGLPKADEY